MKYVSKKAIKYLGLIVIMTLSSGCAINMEVPITDPAPSKTQYADTENASAMTLVFNNQQSEEDKAKVLTGRIPMNLTSQGKPFDSVSWVAKHTVNELKSRGLPVTLDGGSADSKAINIKKLHIRNHRVNGFSPFVTFTMVSADITTSDGDKRVTAYMKRGKVPVWSFDEVIEPTYNAPLSIITKELAAKINQNLFGQIVSNDDVNQLIASIDSKVAANDASAYLDVFQLGFSNNPTCIPKLVELTKDSQEYVRLAAISSLGILKAQDQFDYLVSIYESKDGSWQDRGMALKAIGDIGSSQSRAFLEKEMARIETLADKEATWNKEIIELYLL